MEQRKKRIEYIDIAKAFAIFCVLIGHTVDSGTVVKTAIYAFHMPLFFVLSGMTASVNPDCDRDIVKKTVGKLVHTLVIPYLLWGCIYAPFSFKNLVFIAYGTRETLVCANTLTSLWFLPVIVLANIIFKAVLWGLGNRRRWWKIAFAGVICFLIGIALPHYGKYGNPWGIDIAFVAVAFMVSGYLIRPLFVKMQNTCMWIAAFAAFPGGLLFFIGMHFNSTSVGYVLMANAVYGNPLLFAVGAAGGSLFLLVMAFIYSNLNINKKPLIYIGKNTLGIFFVHKPIVELGRIITLKFGMSYNSPIIFILISLTGILISMIVVYFINYFIPDLIGKGQNRKTLPDRECKKNI